MIRPRCAGTTATGERCRRSAGSEAPFCHQHEAAAWRPVEFDGGPADGQAASLAWAGGGRWAVAVPDREGLLVVLPPATYWALRRQHGELDVRGEYRLTYAGLRAAWRWERTAPDARPASASRPEEPGRRP